MSGSNLPPGVSQLQIDRFYGCDGPDEQEPLYNRHTCYICKRDIMQDDWTRRFYLAEDVEALGMAHMRRWVTDSLNSFETQSGWVCSTACWNDHCAEEA